MNATKHGVLTRRLADLQFRIELALSYHTKAYIPTGGYSDPEERCQRCSEVWPCGTVAALEGEVLNREDHARGVHLDEIVRAVDLARLKVSLALSAHEKLAVPVSGETESDEWCESCVEVWPCGSVSALGGR